MIHILNGLWQDEFDTYINWVWNFFERVPTHDDLKKWFGDQQEGILFLDDLVSGGGDDKDTLNLFTQYSHHLNVTVFYLYQDMFSKGEYAKTISRNAQYIIVFKNPRDNVALRTLLTEMYPNKKWCPVMDTYNQCAQRPFCYLAIDVHPASRDDTRLVSHLLRQEGCIRCYR